MEIINLLSGLIDAGVSDIFANPGGPLHVRGPRGVIPVTDLVRGAEGASAHFLNWLTSEANLPAPKRAEIMQKGQGDYAIALPQGVRLRVHAFRVQDDLAFVVRLIPFTPQDVDQLGLEPVIQQRVTTARGLFLVTGPTGAGKSTTLAALLQFIADTYPYHILTFEDPVEYIIAPQLGLVHQRELYKDFFSFSEGLHGALRESPDVVMIGEMRELETIRWALSLAEAGFLVLGTYHTKSAQDTVDRIIGSFPEREQAQARTRLASALIGTLSQQLLPMEGQPGDATYRPRIVAFEYMFKTPAIASMIRDGKTHLITQELGKAEVGQTLEHRLAFLVRGRYISLETAKANANNLDLLGRLLNLNLTTA